MLNESKEVGVVAGVRRCSVGFKKQVVLCLLHMNLFTHRDLMRWLDEPFATPPDPQDNPQVILAFA